MSGGRPLLGVDCDNVLAAAEPAIVELLIGVGDGDVRGARSSFDLALGMDPGRVAAALSAFHAEENLLGLPAVEGAQEALGALCGDYEIHVVTARPESAWAVTARWLEAQGIPYEGLHLGWGAPGLAGARQKYEIGLPLRAMIEDHLPTALGFAHRGVRSVLFDHPWNRDLGGKSAPASLVRVGSWGEVEGALCGCAENRRRGGGSKC